MISVVTTSTVINSTLSGNSAAPAAASVNELARPTLTRSLISGNSAQRRRRNLEVASASITANAFNVFGHSGQSDADAFVFFTPGASDFNATTDGTPTALANILDTTLADNGGPTQTHALVAGSPAIDFGPTADCAAAPVNGARPAGEDTQHRYPRHRRTTAGPTCAMQARLRCSFRPPLP